MKYIPLFILAIFCVGFELTTAASDSHASMDQNQIKQLLRGNPDPYVAGFVNSSQTWVKQAPSSHFKQHQFYLCVRCEPGMDEGGNFYVCVSTNPSTACILTDSLECLNDAIRTEHIVVSNSAKALSLAKECFEYNRALWHSFHVLERPRECKKMTKVCRREFKRRLLSGFKRRQFYNEYFPRISGQRLRGGFGGSGTAQNCLKG